MCGLLLLQFRKPSILILGGGIVGSNAAQMAAGMGADVTITDINLARLRYLSETLPKNVKTLYASSLVNCYIY